MITKNLSLPILCYDVIFKSIFINQENILAKMVSDITGIDYELLKDNVILETNELPINMKNEKVKRCDFILRINNGNIINLELNSHRYAGMLVKNLSYLFQLFSTSSKRSESYNENLIVTQININCFKEKNLEDIKALSKYHLREDDSNKLYVKNIAIYELNVVKCHELYYNVDSQEQLPNYIKWGALIYSNHIEEIAEVAKEIVSPNERKLIMDKISKLTRDDLFYTEEEALEWAEWERNSIRNEAKEEGIQEGIEQNLKDMILSMKKNNASLEFISKVTNKTIEEIEEILKEE